MDEARRCLHRAGEGAVSCGMARGLRRYQCKGCGRTFNAPTGTPLSGLHHTRSILKQFQERFESGLQKLHKGACQAVHPQEPRPCSAPCRPPADGKHPPRPPLRRHHHARSEGQQGGQYHLDLRTRRGNDDDPSRGLLHLRSNVLDWDADTMWKTCITLTDAEAVFRALKSELGLSPIFHQKEHRADGHLFIPVLAYQAVQVLRTPMKKAGYHDNWTSLRRIPSPPQRTTATFTRRGGKTLHVRKTATADADQAAIYQAMGITSPHRSVHNTVIRDPVDSMRNRRHNGRPVPLVVPLRFLRCQKTRDFLMPMLKMG